MMDVALIVLGIIFLLLGLIGCILPILPGPPLTYISLLLLHFTKAYNFSTQFLITWAVISIVVTVIDNLIPMWGTKKFGGSKKAIWGSMLGLLLGLFLFPPIGIIIGPFAGAVIGELIDGKDTVAAIKSGFGAFVGFLGGTILKLTSSGMMIFYYFSELITHK